MGKSTYKITFVEIEKQHWNLEADHLNSNFRLGVGEHLPKTQLSVSMKKKVYENYISQIPNELNPANLLLRANFVKTQKKDKLQRKFTSLPKQQVAQFPNSPY